MHQNLVLEVPKPLIAVSISGEYPAQRCTRNLPELQEEAEG